jgi:hypothetical protein
VREPLQALLAEWAAGRLGPNAALAAIQKVVAVAPGEGRSELPPTLLGGEAEEVE